MKNLIPFPIFITSIVIAFSSCKQNDNVPSNKIVPPIFNTSVSYGSMTDADGNTYKTVTIGTQTWMAENLRTTKYNDGSKIPNLTDNSEWVNATMGAYCTILNTSDPDIINLFGCLYNWNAINSGKLAPKGWHVPSDAEWAKLADSLGGQAVAGAKLKETSTNHWTSPNNGATNESGFTAVPGGERCVSCSGNDGGYGGGAATGCWWCTTEIDTGLAWARVLYNSDVSLFRFENYKSNGLSVRLVKD
jgi:uncharacterized protein (TIGR02145 family)